MAATYTWEGADQEGDVFEIGGNGSACYMTQDEDWSVLPAASPIPAGQASILRHVRGKFTGSFTGISDVKFYRSDTNDTATGVTLKCGGLVDGAGVTFAEPTTNPSADANIPTTEPGSSNVNVDASGATRYAPALVAAAARWLRLQIQTESGSPPGDIADGDPPMQATMRFTES